MPNLPATGTFRIFPTMGDPMLPIPENSEDITQYVEDWTAIKPDTLCIVILKGEQDFVFKQVTVKPDGEILLRSLNKLYDPYIVGAEEVLEIWQYYKYQSAQLPEPTTDMQELKKLVLEIRSNLKQTKAGLLK